MYFRDFGFASGDNVTTATNAYELQMYIRSCQFFHLCEYDISPLTVHTNIKRIYSNLHIVDCVSSYKIVIFTELIVNWC